MPWGTDGGTIVTVGSYSKAELLAGAVVITAVVNGEEVDCIINEDGGSSGTFYELVRRDNLVNFATVNDLDDDDNDTIVISNVNSNYTITNVRLGTPVHQFEVYTDEACTEREETSYHVDQPIYVKVNKSVPAGRYIEEHGDSLYPLVVYVNTDGSQTISIGGTLDDPAFALQVDDSAANGIPAGVYALDCQDSYYVDGDSEWSLGDIVYI